MVERCRAERCHVRVGSAGRFSIFVRRRIVCFYVAITCAFEGFTFTMRAFYLTRFVHPFFCFVRVVLRFYCTSNYINYGNIAWLFRTRLRVVRIKGYFAWDLEGVDRRDLRIARYLSNVVEVFQVSNFMYLNTEGRGRCAPVTITIRPVDLAFFDEGGKWGFAIGVQFSNFNRFLASVTYSDNGVKLGRFRVLGGNVISTL